MTTLNEIPKIEIYNYLKTLNLHIQNVSLAAMHVKDISMQQIARHDESKFSEQELLGYVLKYSQKRLNYPKEVIDKYYSLAWSHHIHNNLHHWQHWILLEDNNLKCIEMPYNYASEMIADWLGASKTYTNSWDISKWLVKNSSNIYLHKNTQIYVLEKLSILGYKDIIDNIRFKNGE